jgi:hypothetical protein
MAMRGRVEVACLRIDSIQYKKTERSVVRVGLPLYPVFVLTQGPSEPRPAPVDTVAGGGSATGRP